MGVVRLLDCGLATMSDLRHLLNPSQDFEKFVKPWRDEDP